MKISKNLYADDKSLSKFFIVAYLIPIVATALVILIDGFPTDSVVTHVSPMVLVVILRIIILWMYVRTRSVVLGWLTHFSYTGGQLYFV